jgi:PAS domain S-box-containing protein
MVFKNKLGISSASRVFLAAFFVMALALIMVALFVGRDIGKIRANWHAFEDLRSEKMQALVELRRALGYGGLIHNFKNYVLRHGPAYRAAADANLGGVEAGLLLYRAQNPTSVEVVALNDIENVVGAYRAALAQIDEMIDAGASIVEIDNAVRVNDKPALDALYSLSTINSGSVSADNPAVALDNLRGAIGYGGMIHNYKNFILRGDEGYLTATRASIELAQQYMNVYTSSEVSRYEQTAIDNVAQTIGVYEDMLDRVNEMINSGFSPQEIDQEVAISDQNAFNALTALTFAVSNRLNQQAGALAGELETLEDGADWLFWIMIAAFAVILGCASILLLRGILKPLNNIRQVMDRLAMGNFDTEIRGTDRQDEFGLIARAMEVFKRNSIARLLAEKKLRKSEAEHSGILEIASEAIITIDRNQKVRLFNRAAERIFGYDPEEVIGYPVEMLIPEESRKKHSLYVRQFGNESDYLKHMEGRSEIQGRRKDGSQFPAAGSISKLTTDDGILFTIVLRDITESKKSKQRLMHAIEKTEYANRAKSEFLANMSHELRTPLNAILGFSELIKDERMGAIGNKRYLQYAADVNDSGHHLLSIINDILDLSKIEAGMTEMTEVEFEPGEVIQECMKFVEFRANESQIGIFAEHNMENGRLVADRRMFKQIIVNLLSNAVKFSNIGGKIEISTRINIKGALIIVIADNGIGIREEDIDRVLEPFQQVDAGSGRTFEGTGLGLPLVKSLMELHGGEIELSSVRDIGTTVKLIFPRGRVSSRRTYNITAAQ